MTAMSWSSVLLSDNWGNHKFVCLVIYEEWHFIDHLLLYTYSVQRGDLCLHSSYT